MTEAVTPPLGPHRETPVRVGIIGPCPPPHGGVTRLLSNHLAEWRNMPIQTWYMPLLLPERPETEVFPGTTVVDHRKSARAWRAAPGAVARLGSRLGLIRPASGLRVVSHAVALHDLIRRHRIQVIYAHHALLTGAIGVTEARRAGIPSVVVSYGETWLATPQDRARRRLIDYTIACADWVVSTSQHCRRGAISRGAAPDRTSVVYAGIDLERFRPGLDGSQFRAALQIPDDAVVISVLGIALREKLDTFLDALAPLLDVPAVHVLIGGTGADADYLRERVHEVGSERVQALGFVPEGDLPTFYAATDVLVVSPRTVVECMGQSMKEAMACGRAVVGPELGGVPEAVENGVSGLFFKPDDSNDLVSVLLGLVSNSELRRSMGRRGRMIAEEKFDARVSAHQTYELFDRLASQ